MSARPLPDDLSQWPDDPNELLGVSYGIAPRELRRAYNRLIRIYKPEQYPEHFRRIREAYEQLLRIAEWYAPIAEAVDPTAAENPQLLPDSKEKVSDAEAAPWIAGNPQPAEEAAEEVSTPAPRRRSDEMDELWETAIAGRPAAAYLRLTQLTQQYAGRVELYQRLYWLLTLWPDLDSRRVPADWLVQGMLATDWAGPLRELYREEVNNDSAEAFSERYEKLLDSPSSASLLAELMERRFQAAARLERWDVINADLSKLRSRFGVGEEELWLRLLLSVAEAAAWATDAEGERLLSACRAEIEKLEFMNTRMSHSFDRFDLILEASAGWRGLSRRRGVLATISHVLRKPINDPFYPYIHRTPETILKCIGDLCSRPTADVRESLTIVLEAIADSPQKWLKHLDVMHKQAPTALAMLGELLDRFEQSRNIDDGAEAEPDFQTGLVLEFLSRLNVGNYAKARKRVLTFCLREQIAPEEMAEAAGGTWEPVLTADWPLRYVCRACRLFWA
jgi:hypothetical protein